LYRSETKAEVVTFRDKSPRESRVAIVRSITKTDQLYIHFVDDHRETRAADDMNAKPADEQYDLIILDVMMPGEETGRIVGLEIGTGGRDRRN
jgi:CheY-like chemotaxis protein